jgi:hypothetical protein
MQPTTIKLEEATLDQLFTISGQLSFDSESVKYKLNLVHAEISKRLSQPKEETPPEAA